MFVERYCTSLRKLAQILEAGEGISSSTSLGTKKASGSQRHSTVVYVLVLHVAGLDLIPSTPEPSQE